MSIKDFIDKSVIALHSLYPLEEARNIVTLLLCSRLGLKQWELVLRYPLQMPIPLDDDMKRLLKGEPIQYVLGWSEFYGRRYRVDSSVLIPRPETEQMVDMALKLDSSKHSRVLDLCTGSGVIAWTMALERSDFEVVAVDISTDALKVAESQFIVEHTPKFMQGDVLNESFMRGLGKYDLLLSNPPYIMESEKSFMRANVLNYEPSIALFVGDDDPLVFYKAIARCSRFLLKNGGEGIVEINESLGEQTAEVFVKEGLKNVSIIKDYYAKMRFVTFKNAS
ncbi:MAG TPA: peptide chain release factor N(5)-glutamine methyltransferase [Rikenellaceae bacterium]|nr:peptide chain release factor N(5)-glutamine methyltransferase [Rikenellaceae bacterium]